MRAMVRSRFTRPGPTNCETTGVAEAEGGGHGEGLHFEPAIRNALAAAQVAVAQTVGADAAGGVGGVAGDGGGERNSRLRAEDRREHNAE